MCFVLLITCVVAISNGAVGSVALYEDDVQKRVVELGLTTKKKIKKSFVILALVMFIPLFTLVPFMVYFVNGAYTFWEGFCQMSIIMWIMGLFDRLFIDLYWVGHTKAWYIEGTEDLMPYIPVKAMIVKWTFTILGMPLISALIAFVMTFIL